MGSLRVLLALTATSLALLGACGGSSTTPPPSNGALDCLAYPLTSYCCSDSGAPICVADFATASQCATWSTHAKVMVYPSACQGLVAVSVVPEDETYTSVYVYDASTSTLYAVGDDAASDQAGDQAVECGAGPQGFTMPAACGTEWLDATKAQACTSGTAAVTSLCH